MQELYTAVSNLTFSSFCNRIAQKENGTIEFELKHSFHSNCGAEIYCIQELDDSIIISDMGCTLKNLSEVPELTDIDIGDIINKIRVNYGMVKIGSSFIYRINPSSDALSQIWHFICGIQFLYAMKIFCK